MFGFLKGVRDSEAHRDAKFLILSLHDGVAGAQLDSSTARAGIVLGADAYVAMPVFDAHQLVAQIKKLQPSIPRLQRCSNEAEKHRSE